MIPKTCGDLRTKVRVQFKTSEKLPGERIGTDEWVDIGNTSGSDPPGYKYCLWVGAHGNEAFELNADVAAERATLTFRHDKRINKTCRVLYNNSFYDIISVDHVRQKGQWTEIKIRRAAKG